MHQGFTLIELLVVITIIAILAGVALPVFGKIQLKAKANRSLQHAKQIGLALKDYAGDHSGAYPTGDNANEALGKLVRDMGNEKVFFVPGCRWHGGPESPTANGPDDLYEESEPPGTALERGENHWSYARGFTDTSKASYPLIATGFTDTIGQYTEYEEERGGVWKGRYCVVIYCDASGEMPVLTKKGDKYFYIKEVGQAEFDPLNQTRVKDKWVNPNPGS